MYGLKTRLLLSTWTLLFGLAVAFCDGTPVGGGGTNCEQPIMCAGCDNPPEPNGQQCSLGTAVWNCVQTGQQASSDHCSAKNPKFVACPTSPCNEVETWVCVVNDEMCGSTLMSTCADSVISRTLTGRLCPGCD